MYIIPAIDIIDGKCVRLTKGDYNQKTEYNSNPLAVAKEFEAAGLKRLHLVDLDGAKAKKVINLPVLRSIAENTALEVDFGGGVQSTEDLAAVFKAGAKQITGGSVAVKNEALFTEWIQEFGGEKIILGADVKGRNIAIHGWQESADWHIFDFLEHYLNKGITHVVCTDVSKDGVLQGTSNELYAEIIERFPQIKLIASGGVSSMNDLDLLDEMNIYGAIVGKAIYEKRIELNELERFLK
ncbi:1-(5-phosphoribosyl)-5-[(5-phosphoribosylamino)methylideneamino]imidazole-4-carboxamide isomerase [Marivirga sp. S37H4]|uniref:1-(5-phosphoribosyl)-5-[(5-phosphoribosylamino)methylideneamino] imidazole-4-carboxamide isomerase n=1 Tax=Marivirga aurantiaca TaxID=2802615 RepID=A0A934X0F9_9BACT|nr:1-(5-phosphoribosyl)-5-[(5-phosphoribosylamino)methylideneamino]imidazole-4-carboxamide isomerase [Marivirga aurantiaca]MBK6266222.1 1-(5-phosphoribosyl)-5-[(5-phosphoribosylamino)methylideneamino]imidazole-4-carboxamide isomerase [Marivirga aurantiaca]